MRSFNSKTAISVALLAGAAFAGAQNIQVQVNGTPLYFANGQPQMIGGRVMVPMRRIFEQLGANVNYDNQTRRISANKSGSDVELWIGRRSAQVNGSNVMLDVPPMILNGSTMVPIRFVSESLGANVGWISAQNLVTIDTTSASATYNEPPRYLHRIAMDTNTVIPVRLDNRLSSTKSMRGDSFTTTVLTNGSKDYDSLPSGTKIEGHIAAVRPQEGNRPAIMDLTFDRIRFPDGNTERIDGSLISLENRNVSRNRNGVWVAHGNATKDNRMVYAGYGAGAGLLVGVLTNKPLEGTILGGVLGYIAGQVQQDQRHPSNITLRRGTEMGVRLNSNFDANWRSK